jgi:hypothetical protein
VGQWACQRLAALRFNKDSLKLETIKPAQHPAAETGWLGSNSKPITVQFLGLELARVGTARQGHCCG